jgi:hypothetical protein
MAAGSRVAANRDRGSVPSRILLSGSATELEEEHVEDVLPFRFTFLVFDSVTCRESLWKYNRVPETSPYGTLTGPLPVIWEAGLTICSAVCRECSFLMTD